MAEILPDCRTKDSKGIVQSKTGNWIPIFCANCGKSGGLVPEDNMNFAFYLCNYCVETYGKIAETMIVPDEKFWAEVAAEQKEKKMIAIQQAKESARVGWWYAECCAHGLTQIKTEEDLKVFHAQIEDDGFKALFQGAWPTRDEALLDLKARGIGLEDSN